MTTAPMSPQPPDPRWKIARGFPRFALTVKVRLTTADAGQRIIGRMVDVGLGGFCAELDTPLPEKKVSAEFRVPLANTPLVLRAIVRHNEGSRYGFQFLGITPEQREMIRSGCELLPKV
jgi:hypothetical protein